jgi:hypothetical protein
MRHIQTFRKIVAEHFGSSEDKRVLYTNLFFPLRWVMSPQQHKLYVVGANGIFDIILISGVKAKVSPYVYFNYGVAPRPSYTKRRPFGEGGRPGRG